MKKSDLKDGMIVETKESRYLINDGLLLGRKGFMKLTDYTEDLKLRDRDYVEFDINVVYAVDAWNYGLSCFLNNGINIKDKAFVIWERQREIDWSKVPFGVKVFVCDYPLTEEEIKNKCFYDDEEPFEFICYRDEIKKFIVFDREYNEVYSFKYCYFHQSVKIKEEWYKE